MKLLTLNFLTCAVKSCRAAATSSSTLTRPSDRTSGSATRDPGDGDNADETSETRQQQGASFPLHLAEVELTRVELEFNELFWRNILPRLDLGAMQNVLEEAGLRLPEPLLARVERGKGEGEGDVQMGDDGLEGGGEETQLRPFTGADAGVGGGDEVDEATLQKLHSLLLETQVQEGWLVCGRCGHRYAVKEGIPNFLLPPHLVG